MSFHSVSARLDWSASQYLKFENERTRPVYDLLSRVTLQSPKSIVDLGCGPGNSTAVLRDRYPDARILGIDSSPDMIEKAKQARPSGYFIVQDLESYTPTESVDLFFSNAVLHWIRADQRVKLIRNLMKNQLPGGVFAFQVPDNLSEPSHTLMSEVATQGPWADKLRNAGRDPFQTPQEIYDSLKPFCSDVHLFKTKYFHPLEGHKAILEWVKGSGLRPYLDPLTAEERELFLDTYLKSLEKAYPRSVDGRVLLCYPRLFVVAVKG